MAGSSFKCLGLPDGREVGAQTLRRLRNFGALAEAAIVWILESAGLRPRTWNPGTDHGSSCFLCKPKNPSKSPKDLQLETKSWSSQGPQGSQGISELGLLGHQSLHRPGSPEARKAEAGRGKCARCAGLRKFSTQTQTQLSTLRPRLRDEPFSVPRR